VQPLGYDVHGFSELAPQLHVATRDAEFAIDLPVHTYDAAGDPPAAADVGFPPERDVSAGENQIAIDTRLPVA
jgi:hypothetical protein